MQVLPGVMKPDVSIRIGLPHLRCVCCNSLICISSSSKWKKKKWLGVLGKIIFSV